MQTAACAARFLAPPRRRDAPVPRRVTIFLSDPVKDDSAENGMPLAFLISAFCRPLSANGRDRAIAVADSAARSATRNIRRGNIHTPVSCRAEFSIFPGVLSLSLSVSLAAARQELFGAET